MAVKRTVKTSSCQFQLRLSWELREKIEAQLKEDQSLAGWIKEACEMRLDGLIEKKFSKEGSQEIRKTLSGK